MQNNEDRDYEETLLTEKQAAAFLGLAPRTLAKWRVVGGGPPFRKLSKRAVRYKRLDLMEWSDAQLRHSTSDTGNTLEAKL